MDATEDFAGDLFLERLYHPRLTNAGLTQDGDDLAISLTGRMPAFAQ